MTPSNWKKIRVALTPDAENLLRVILRKGFPNAVGSDDNLALAATVVLHAALAGFDKIEPLVSRASNYGKLEQVEVSDQLDILVKAQLKRIEDGSSPPAA
jgi:hypothetical protein